VGCLRRYCSGPLGPESSGSTGGFRGFATFARSPNTSLRVGIGISAPSGVSWVGSSFGFFDISLQDYLADSMRPSG
jgi:hypothetical protein